MNDITTAATHDPAVVPAAVQDWVRQQHEQQAEYDRMRALIDQYETRQAVLDDQNVGLRTALIDVSAKADYYMRLNAELNQIFNNVVALCGEAAKARQHVGRPNGAAPTELAEAKIPGFLTQPLAEPR